MNSSANINLDTASIRLTQKPEGNPNAPEQEPHNATTRASEKPNAEKPPDPYLNGPSYRAISVTRSAILLGNIIAGNCLCSAIICLCLWGFSKIHDMSKWEKRAFNTLSLLLSASLAFGIGFLFDQIGLLARGTLLQRNRYSMKGIGYIMRGTLSSYALLFIHQVRPRRKRVASTTWILFLFLLCSLVGRFGVAFLGFAFNIEDRLHYIPPLFRPNWENGTVNPNTGDQETALAYPVSVPQGARGLPLFLSSGIAGALFQLAQTVKGLPQLQTTDSQHIQENNDHDRGESQVINISVFSTTNCTMEISSGHGVSFRYKFRDFRGATPVFAGWEGLIRTQCRRFETIPDTAVNVSAVNVSADQILGHYRWIYTRNLDPEPAQGKYPSHGADARHEGAEMLLVKGSSVSAQQQSPNLTVASAPHVGVRDENASNMETFFNCSIYFVDLRTNSQHVAPLDVYDNRTALESQSNTTLDVPMVGPRVHWDLRGSLALSEIGVLGRNPGRVAAEDSKTFRDFFANNEFRNGIRQHDQRASELWLSAYIGNYIGNCLSFLNDFLERVEIEREEQGFNTKLLVKWERVAATFGSLAFFQVLFGLAALLYCRESFEVVDDVLTFSSMFTGFPFDPEEHRQKEGAVYQGRFASEGDGFRWKFFAETEKDEV